MSEHDGSQRLETALARSEADADAALKAAATLTKALKRFRNVVHEGNLRDISGALAGVEQALSTVQQRVEAAQRGWDFDEADYFGSGAYTRELLETAARLNVQVFEQDDRLYSYPALVRVLASERTVLIDRARERRLRPSLLVSHLRDLRDRPARFKPQAFLDALFGAYRVLVQRHGRDALQLGRTERLVDLYEVLTLLPGQSREYSRQEFARDVYLLDQSGVVETRDGYVVRFPASTGTKAPSGVLTAISRSGQEQTYWGIAFSKGG